MSLFKNDVGRPSNKTILVRNVLKGILAIIILCSIFAGGYYLSDYKNKKEIAKYYDIKYFNKAIQDYVDTIDSSGKFGYFYEKNRYANSLDNDVILISAISSLEKNNKTTFSSNEVKNRVKEIFGDIHYKNRSINSGCYVYNYNKSTGKYTSDSGCSGDGPKTYSKVIDVYKSGNKINVINYVAFANFDYNTGVASLYKDPQMNKLIESNYDYNKGIDDYSSALTDSYKWTFIEDSEGNLIFKSVEKETKNYRPDMAFDIFVKNNNLITYTDEEVHSDDDVPVFNKNELKKINCVSATQARPDASVDVYYAYIYTLKDEDSARKYFIEQSEAEKNPSGVDEDYKQKILSEKSGKNYELLEMKSTSGKLDGGKTYEYYYALRINNYYIQLNHAEKYNEESWGDYMIKDMIKLKDELNTLLNIK